MAQHYKDRDIIEVIEEYIDLEEGGTPSRPYLRGLCPFHNDNDPSFVIFPKIQKWTCWSCYPGEYKSAIDFIKQYKDVDFEEARRIASELITAEDAFRKVLEAEHTDLHFDNKLVAHRLFNLHDRFEFETAERIKQQVDELLDAGRWAEVDRRLRRYGV